jgi:hypothetical protein
MATRAHVPRTSEDLAEESAGDLVRFLRGLPEAAKREYEELASRDREFGEDVVEERRKRGAGTAS